MPLVMRLAVGQLLAWGRRYIATKLRQLTCVFGRAQGVAQAKLAWKQRNAVPQTTKAAKDMRPTGRGGFGTAQQQGGRGGVPPPGVVMTLDALARI